MGSRYSLISTTAASLKPRLAPRSTTFISMGASKRCIILLTVLLAYVSAQEVVRRVPQGFLGMRGKKYYELDGPDQLYKRKPQFFVGVKGKKGLYDDVEYKRVPMGFVGMRGKKALISDFMNYPENYEYVPKRSGSLIGQIDYSTDNLPEYPVLNEVIEEYLQKLRDDNTDIQTETSDEDESGIFTNEVEKRANIHKFFGVRGKKSGQAKRPYDVSFRGKFIGVRGKKDVKNSGQEEFEDNEPWTKRRQTGFMGVRGKKWGDIIDSEPSDMNVTN
ncbi:unnamed protein product [Danaus chrysippus]|uniref:(African queen) hypothetical protein n=1 Tax=Danaus chrysippus TaxID=151541 RepID=A0A8J2W4Z1_9NEOP|nr:unnamed protein product [Danaus chrysippus]